MWMLVIVAAALAQDPAEQSTDGPAPEGEIVEQVVVPDEAAEAPVVEPAPPPEPAAEEPAAEAAERYRSLFTEVDRMAAAREFELARSTLRYLAESDAPSDVREEARRRLAGLPAPRQERQYNYARVAVWQGLGGGAALGAVIGNATESGTAAATSALIGGGLGVATTLAWHRGPGLSDANTTAIIGLEQLGAFHGLMLPLAVEADGTILPTTMFVGGLIGASAAAAMTAGNIDDQFITGVRAGSFWGLGLGASALTMAYRWEEPPSVVVPVLLLATDLGAVGGGLLAPRLGLDRTQLRMINIGGLFGGGAAYCFAWASQQNILWTDAAVMGAVTVGALAGGSGGALLVRRYRGTGPGVELSTGVPLVMPDRGGLRIDVPILSGRF